MKATATDITHVSKLGTPATVNRRWFPKVFTVSEDRGHRYEEVHTTMHLHG